jgi:hypothetical protein
MLHRFAFLVALAIGMAAGPLAQSLSADGSSGTAVPVVATEAATHAAAAGVWRSRNTPVEMLPVYYVVERRPDLRAGPGSGRVLGQLEFRRGVRIRAEQGPWRLVEDVETGRSLGWVEETALSNVWILMDKPSRTLYVYRGAELMRELPADVSANPEGNKVRRSSLGEQYHYRIPEGTYFVTARNPNSQYYRSFMLNYPNADDARRGLTMGLITRAQYRAIVDAAERFQSPPMGTLLGGAIAIHGQGSGRRRAWTRGCVALRDVHMDLLWDIVRVGTPVYIR